MSFLYKCPPCRRVELGLGDPKQKSRLQPATHGSVATQTILWLTRLVHYTPVLLLQDLSVETSSIGLERLVEGFEDEYVYTVGQHRAYSIGEESLCIVHTGLGVMPVGGVRII